MAGLVGKRTNGVLMGITLARLKKPWSLTSTFARPKQSFWKRLLIRGGNFLPLKRLRFRQTPIDELGRKHRLFAMCFPTLFPYGTADWHQGRMRNVSLADWGEHFLKFHDGRFGAHPRFRFLVFNMLMRNKAREASGFWVKKRPDLLGLSLDELKELLGEGEHDC